MGILNKWFKKKKQEQLEAVEKSGPEVKLQKKEKKEPAAEAGPAKKLEKGTVGARLPQSNKAEFAGKILLKPIVSEKAAGKESAGVYTFQVNTKATKSQVGRAIDELYGVRSSKVRMINVQGKWKNFGRQSGRRSDYKKAIVTLPKGQTINIHEGV